MAWPLLLEDQVPNTKQGGNCILNPRRVYDRMSRTTCWLLSFTRVCVCVCDHVGTVHPYPGKSSHTKRLFAGESLCIDGSFGMKVSLWKPEPCFFPTESPYLANFGIGTLILLTVKTGETLLISSLFWACGAEILGRGDVLLRPWLLRLDCRHPREVRIDGSVNRVQ